MDALRAEMMPGLERRRVVERVRTRDHTERLLRELGVPVSARRICARNVSAAPACVLPAWLTADTSMADCAAAASGSSEARARKRRVGVREWDMSGSMERWPDAAQPQRGGT